MTDMRAELIIASIRQNLRNREHASDRWGPDSATVAGIDRRLLKLYDDLDRLEADNEEADAPTASEYRRDVVSRFRQYPST
jgi:hypothetical protein